MKEHHWVLVRYTLSEVCIINDLWKCDGCGTAVISFYQPIISTSTPKVVIVADMKNMSRYTQVNANCDERLCENVLSS